MYVTMGHDIIFLTQKFQNTLCKLNCGSILYFIWLASEMHGVSLIVLIAAHAQKAASTRRKCQRNATARRRQTVYVSSGRSCTKTKWLSLCIQDRQRSTRIHVEEEMKATEKAQKMPVVCPGGYGCCGGSGCSGTRHLRHAENCLRKRG